MLAGSVSPEASLLSLQTAAFSLCPQVAFPLAHTAGVSSSPKDTGPIGLVLYPYDLT